MLPPRIISTKEAKKLLGKKYAHLSDIEIDEIVTKLYLIAKGTIQSKGGSIDLL